MIRAHREQISPAGFAPPHLPRVAEPELRSRIVGYLRHAPALGDGRRSDGEWVWPETLAETVAARGVGPSPAMLEAMLDRELRPPRELTASTAAEARRAELEPASMLTDVYLMDRVAGVIWRRAGIDLVRVAPVGLNAALTECAPPPGGLVEVAPAVVASILDTHVSDRFEALRRAGSESPPGSPPMMARVFDGHDPSGRPWFSPSRLRLVAPGRRERIAEYLDAGRMVVRATGKAPDPLATSEEPVVPLSWRTDGRWVWQDALAHYVRTLGVAPELALLCHIDEAGPAPAHVTDDEAMAAATTVASGPRPWPERTGYRYAETADRLLLRYPDEPAGPGAPDSAVEVLDRDLRWRPPARDAVLPPPMRAVDEAAVVALLREAGSARPTY
jgi:hypothetical protein